MTRPHFAAPGGWNHKVRKIKSRLIQTAWPKMKRSLAEHAAPAIVASFAEWDSLHAVMVEEFEEYSPPRFFLDLLEVYETGRFPCGWIDDRLAVF